MSIHDTICHNVIMVAVGWWWNGETWAVATCNGWCWQIMFNPLLIASDFPPKTLVANCNLQFSHPRLDYESAPASAAWCSPSYNYAVPIGSMARCSCVCRPRGLTTVMTVLRHATTVFALTLRWHRAYRYLNKFFFFFAACMGNDPCCSRFKLWNFLFCAMPDFRRLVVNRVRQTFGHPCPIPTWMQSCEPQSFNYIVEKP